MYSISVYKYESVTVRCRGEPVRVARLYQVIKGFDRNVKLLFHVSVREFQTRNASTIYMPISASPQKLEDGSYCHAMDKRAARACRACKKVSHVYAVGMLKWG